MKYTDDDIYVLDDGTEIYANLGIIGISPECCCDGDWYIKEGCDGGIWESRKWNKKQKQEVSEYMIQLWKDWANK